MPRETPPDSFPTEYVTRVEFVRFDRAVKPPAAPPGQPQSYASPEETFPAPARKACDDLLERVERNGVAFFKITARQGPHAGRSSCVEAARAIDWTPWQEGSSTPLEREPTGDAAARMQRDLPAAIRQRTQGQK